MKTEITAMRFAGIGCGLMLAVIAYYVFTLPSETFVKALTTAGQLVGAGTTVGIFMLALLPPLTGLLFYIIFKAAKR